MEPRVVNQIAEQFRSAGAQLNRQVVIRLNPPELGRVRMTVRSDRGELRAVLDVDNSRTASELQRQVPALIQRMSDMGVQLRRLDVNVTGDDSSGQAQSALQDGQGARQQAAEGETDQAFTGDQTGLESEFAASSDPAPSDSYATDQSINVWI